MSIASTIHDGQSTSSSGTVLTSDPRPGVLPKTTHSRGPHARTATGVSTTTLPPPDDSSSGPAFQRGRGRRNNGRYIRQI
ncbi:hypothetical protein F5X97DRAFT_247252 [Nemania serpens]|nr:hypothetical protein F5X97DRAFT_247252 [Nemania serpens]